MESESIVKIAALVQLSQLQVKHGETFDFGWFTFRVVIENDVVDFETLDFLEFNSFTRDFSIVEKIYLRQIDLVKEYKVKRGECTQCDTAIVHKSYQPGQEHVVMYRGSRQVGSLSGWSIFPGPESNNLLVPEIATDQFHDESLYELTFNDPRFAPFWLLPAGYSVIFLPGNVVPIVYAGSWWRRLKRNLLRR